MRRRTRKSDCPIHFALEAFGDAWTLLIIRDLMFKGRTTYTDYLHAEEGIATNILADRLARLEEEGIITKRHERVGAKGFRYRLTHKGIDLLPVMLEIIAWSAKYDPDTAADRGFLHSFQRDQAGFTARLRAGLESLAAGEAQSQAAVALRRQTGGARNRDRRNAVKR